MHGRLIDGLVRCVDIFEIVDGDSQGGAGGRGGCIWDEARSEEQTGEQAGCGKSVQQGGVAHGDGSISVSSLRGSSIAAVRWRTCRSLIERRRSCRSRTDKKRSRGK